MRIFIYPIALVGLFIFWITYEKPLATLELLNSYWPSALTMVFGSFVAGITPLGGGAVAFPIFTKAFNLAAYDAKIFSLLIQAVGMSFASLFFISQKTFIIWRPLLCCLPVCLIAVPLSLYNGVEDSNWLKFAFSEFILITAWVIWLCQHSKQTPTHPLRKNLIPLLISAAIGSFLSTHLGSGSDVMMFFVLVYILKYPIKQAIPTTVVLMAINAIYASVLILWINPIELTEFVTNSWWAACLVVALGAPLGGWVLLKINDAILRKIIYLIISIELLSTIYIANLSFTFNFILVLSSLCLLSLIINNEIKSSKHKRKLM